MKTGGMDPGVCCGRGTESLLGLKGVSMLDIGKFNLDGQKMVKADGVRQLYVVPRQVPGIISEGRHKLRLIG